MLYYDIEARRQLGRERASELAEEYRRAQRLPRHGSRPAARVGIARSRVLRRGGARRAPAYRA